MPSIPATIFRAYDIRGQFPSELNTDNIKLIGAAIASEALDCGINTLLLARDARLSSPELHRALLAAILATGCDVVDLGIVPTPLLYFATHTLRWHSGVMLTASHNPADYNGLKIVFERSCLANNQIQQIRKRIEDGQFQRGKGEILDFKSSLDAAMPDSSIENIKQAYVKYLSQDIELSRPLKIVIDCGNAVSGIIAPELFKQLGCDTSLLFCQLDGNFPNHHPDPTVAENLRQLRDKVIASQADLGIAFDGDGDRLGLVTNRGEIIDADKMLMLLAKHILPKYPGSDVVCDVKCSSKLFAMIEAYGGKAVVHRSGHSYMKQKMQATGACLGGEYAAHIFIKDRWFGFDDGLYTAARIIEILCHDPRSSSQVFASFPSGISTGEIKIEMSDSEKFHFMDKLISYAHFKDCKINLIDGLRVDFDYGWGLIRASNTSPALLLRFEADSTAQLESIKAMFKALLRQVDSQLITNF
ncbi:MAG: phosphomannomutase/phosphoglucomutase [SAR86 cluster bacterium]|uniref:phosphomannomutase n=1 Tax=SAR86 cluster bacterium TaxID=2030880 RepID=A0A2A4MUC9_9GAMM|nr:MAG: phosphomannomutase/phosphoglucomutase [SAR86 cluster bacterium]